MKRTIFFLLPLAAWMLGSCNLKCTNETGQYSDGYNAGALDKGRDKPMDCYAFLWYINNGLNMDQDRECFCSGYEDAYSGKPHAFNRKADTMELSIKVPKVFIPQREASEDGTDPAEVTETEPDNSAIFTVVEEMPEYPGGDEARVAFLSKNIQYPQLAKESGVQGTVYLTFVVDTKGNVTHVEVLRGIGSGCDEEAARVTRMMPRWKPGKQSGKPVQVQFNMPVKFSLQ
jgi:TonB family protein